MTTRYPATTYAFLDQPELWRNAKGDWVQVADMSPEYRFNCARMLLGRAARYAFAVEMEELNSTFGWPDDMEPYTVNNPDRWMRERLLYRSLVTGLPTRGGALSKLAERARHYSTCPMRLRRKLRPADAVCACPSPAREVG